MAEHEEIVRTRRYVLAETAEGFAIRVRGAPGEPLERFPLTAEGFDQAMRRLSELKREDRRRRGMLHRALWWTILGGATLWLVGGVWLTAFSFVPSGPISQVPFALDAVGIRLALGGVLLLIALVVLGWEDRMRAGPGPAGAGREATLQPAADRPGAWDRALVWVVGAGLAVWTLSAIAVALSDAFALGPFDVEPFPGGALEVRQPSSVYKLSLSTGGAAFHVWVAALVLLLIRWGWRWVPPRRPTLRADRDGGSGKPR